MKYYQVDILTNKQGLEVIQGALLEVGITDMVVDDPDDLQDLLNKKNDYDWDYIDTSVLAMENQQPKITLYFNDDEEGRENLRNTQTICENLKHLFMDLGPMECTVEEHDDSEWKDNWKEFFKPARISERIVVKPTWEEYEPKENDLVLQIDPGMAFGTGTHETTSLCVKLMEKYMKSEDYVLDVGCGSGILSIAGALLGAKDVLGIDIDPIAVEVSQENIELNGVQAVARAQYGDLTKGVDYKADIVVANLMADLVMIFSADVSKHMKPGAKYISSGILDEKVDQVVECINGLDLKVIEVKQDGMWCAVVAEKL